MSKKKKFSKVKNKAKQEKQTVSAYPKDWLYLNQQEVPFFQLKEVLEKSCAVEYWEEAKVLEAEVSADGAVMDFEPADTQSADAQTLEYLQEQKIQTVVLVTIDPQAFAECKRVMEKVIEEIGGFFCGDTADFTPLVHSCFCS